jgi:hypothetical protein
VDSVIPKSPVAPYFSRHDFFCCAIPRRDQGDDLERAQAAVEGFEKGIDRDLGLQDY